MKSSGRIHFDAHLRPDAFCLHNSTVTKTAELPHMAKNINIYIAVLLYAVLLIFYLPIFVYFIKFFKIHFARL